MNRLKSAQNGSEEVAVSSDKIVPLTDKKVLGKSVKKFLPDDIKDMTGIKLNTANGEIIIDTNIKKSELKNILDNRTYGKAEKGSKIIYTNSKITMQGTIGSYVPENDTVIINLDGLNKAKNENYDVVLVDTAGRLQNKANLMKELEKMNRVIGEIVPGNPVETLLVIDATTGQNGVTQAKKFKEITNITGIVLTKLDGTAKGGVVIGISDQFKIPVRYIGLGEQMTDLQVFDKEEFVKSLLQIK